MDTQQKQQIIEQLQSANNVLIAVSNSPSVDELSAAIGLTLALNKLDKHATTVFSGVVPSTIEFLQPEKLIESTTDSLRDFIIALDKSKADKLRYKVEDDVVRIFITPFQTTITEKDLEFSQGDFNVDLVVALGVGRREDLDAAITAHGRILHDATVVSMTNKPNASELGSIHWQDEKASSLCEMIAIMTTELRQEPLFDGQMATAYLTGIVAETNRFKNERTTPRALSMSSQLMSYGANQQLIAEQLEKPEPLPENAISLKAPTTQDDEPPTEIQDIDNTDRHDEQQVPKPESSLNQLSDDDIDKLLNGGSEDSEHSEASEESIIDQPTTKDGSLVIEHPSDERLQEIRVDDSGDVEKSSQEEHEYPRYEPELKKPEDHSDIEEYSGSNIQTTSSHTPQMEGTGSDDTSQESTSSPVGQPKPIHEEDFSDFRDRGSKTVLPPMPAPLHTMPQPLTSAQPPETPAQEPRQDMVQSPSSVIKEETGEFSDTSDQPTGIGAMPQPLHHTMRHEKVLTPPNTQHNLEYEDDTLDDLESRLESHESVVPDNVPPPIHADIDKLRDSVAKAADALPPMFPTPKQSISSTPLELANPLHDDHENKPNLPPPPPPPSKSTVPPPVPPPMMPQFYDEPLDDNKK